jgi:hypothetical protein
MMLDVDWQSPLDLTRVHLGLLLIPPFPGILRIEILTHLLPDFGNKSFSIQVEVKPIPYYDARIPKWGIATVTGGCITTVVLVLMVAAWSKVNSNDYSPLG